MEEPRPKNYLREEFVQRLKRDHLEYKLQVQLHKWKEDDTNILYNASVPWDKDGHPWIDVASIVLNALLPENVTEVTRFNIGHLPKDTLSFLEATSNADFNSVPNLRAEVYELVSKLRPREIAPAQKGESVEYLIHTVTGEHLQAGNVDQHCNIYVCIIGNFFF